MNVPYLPGQPGRRPSAAPSEAVEMVRLDHPADLITALPYLLGHHLDPGSVVLVALHAGWLQWAARVDAANVQPDDTARVWARLARPLAEASAEAVTIVGYLPETGERLLTALAAGAPVPVRDVLRVHDDRWWSLTCTGGPGCCPGGQPVVADPAVVAPFIAVYGAPAASQADLAACLYPGPAEVVAAVAGLLPLNPAPTPAALYRAVADAHAEYAAYPDGPLPLSPARAAVLLHALTDVRIRDACCSWHDDAAQILWGTLAGYAPPTHVAPVAALMATTSYQRGNAVLARLAADHALTFDPDYRLAQLVMGMLAARMNPAMVQEAFAHARAEIADHPDYAELALPPTGAADTPQGGEHGG